MASRGSFQKRQKEAARKEKRQMKLDRRQGRAPAVPTLNGYTSANEHTGEHDQSEGAPDDSGTSPASPDSNERTGGDTE